MIRGMKQLGMAIALIAMALTSRQAAAQALKPTPQQVAQRCVDHCNAMSADCVAQIQNATTRANNDIKALLALGKKRQAMAVAQNCANNVRQRGHACIAAIERNAHDCAALLKRMGAPKALADAMLAQCRQAAQKVRQAIGQSLQQLRQNFPRAEDPGVGGIDG